MIDYKDKKKIAEYLSNTIPLIDGWEMPEEFELFGHKLKTEFIACWDDGMEYRIYDNSELIFSIWQAEYAPRYFEIVKINEESNKAKEICELILGKHI